MESISVTIDTPEIRMAEINSGASSQGPQNQDQAPDRRLLHDKVEEHDKICWDLRNAAQEGDWKEALRIFEISKLDRRSVLGTAITEKNETALHVAIGKNQIAFAMEILRCIQPEDLTLEDLSGNTAFSVAVAAGNLEIAEAMILMDPNLVKRKDGMNKTPLYKAVKFRRKEMAMFLYGKTFEFFNQDEQTDLFFRSMEADLFGIALKLLQQFPELASSHDVNGETVLHLLSRKPSSNFIQETMITGNRESESTAALFILDRALSTPGLDSTQTSTIQSAPNALLNAARLGNFGFLDRVIRAHPSLVHELDDNQQTIFHIAILRRHTSVFNLIHKLESHDKEVVTTYVDVDGNNMLHPAAKYPDPPPPSSKSSAALEMQQELIIFQEFKKLLPPPLSEAKNAEGLTPEELFTIHHRGLVQNGAKWMKDTASSCMLVATLIATVVFSAAFTVPGGSDDKTGATLLLKKIWFHVFAISDAIALSSSSFSILIFLSITTSDFAQAAFHISLLRRLMIGMVALFVSIVSMMVTFTSNYFLVYGDRSFYIPILSLLFASVPISLFVMLQYSLLREMFHLTYPGSMKSTDMSSFLVLSPRRLKKLAK